MALVQCALKVDGASASGQLIDSGGENDHPNQGDRGSSQGASTRSPLRAGKQLVDLIVSSLAISAIAVTNADLG